MTVHRVNPEGRKAETYRPGQARDHFIPHVPAAPGWFIDCGPGSGTEYLDALKAWPNVQLLGLEPSPAGFRVATRRWSRDHILLLAAAWDVDGAVTLYWPEDILHSSAFPTGAHQESGIVPEGDHTDDRVEVRARSLDSLVRQYGVRGDVVLWADVEGAERRVLRGAAGLLNSGRVSAVNVETRPATSSEIGAILARAGLTLCWRYFESATVRDEVWVRGGRPDPRLAGEGEWGRAKACRG